MFCLFHLPKSAFCQFMGSSFDFVLAELYECSVDIYLSYLSKKKKKSGLFDISTLTLLFQ